MTISLAMVVMTRVRQKLARQLVRIDEGGGVECNFVRRVAKISVSSMK